MSLLRYLFYANPRQADYYSPWVVALLCLGLGLILLSIGIRFWRNSTGDTIAKRLSMHWARSSFWFGFISLLLTISRVEGIQFFSMRIFWALWILALCAYVFFQVKRFLRQHYHILPSIQIKTEKEKYLPSKKRR